jgi:hypothetical protein
MKFYLLFTMACLAVTTLSQDKPKTIGEIEFFGYTGIDINKLRAELPFHEGDEFNFETAEEKFSKTKDVAQRFTGRPPTDINATCCDNWGNWIIFIGLSGASTRYAPRPKGTIRLPSNIIALYDRYMNAVMEASQKGAATEDRTSGYALTEYPPLRSIQLEMRAYAESREALLSKVLATSSADQHRIAAAALLGYTRQSGTQLTALSRATHDSNSTVRNNATRALLVLAESSQEIAAQIPAEGFVQLLSSGTWTDLNKASGLLMIITQRRNPKVDALLRQKETLERLIEIARWRTGHADAARFILGRLAGVDEGRLRQMIESGQFESIISSLQGK